MSNPLRDIKEMYGFSVVELGQLTGWTNPTVRRHLKMEQAPPVVAYAARRVLRQLKSREKKVVLSSPVEVEEIQQTLGSVSDQSIIETFEVSKVTVRNWRATPFLLKNIQCLALKELAQS